MGQEKLYTHEDMLTPFWASKGLFCVMNTSLI